MPFIRQIVIGRGALLGFYRKITVEDEEAAWFSAGQSAPNFSHESLPFSVTMLNDSLPDNRPAVTGPDSLASPAGRRR